MLGGTTTGTTAGRSSVYFFFRLRSVDDFGLAIFFKSLITSLRFGIGIFSPSFVRCVRLRSMIAPTTDGNNPMHPYVRLGLMNQIEMQCQFVIMAYRQLKIASSVREAFYAINALLGASANISKAAWGLRGKDGDYYDDRIPIRQALSLIDDSPLYPLLDVRNGFEHYDQRLVTEIAKNPKPLIIDSIVGPPSSITVTPNQIRLRQFDPTTAEVQFLGYSINLNDIVNEVQRILPLAETEARAPLRTPDP